MKNKFQNIFGNTKPVIAMIHLQALPGTPNQQLSIKEVMAKALQEAAIYSKAGVDAILMENMHDIPYLRRDVGHEISTAMAVVTYEVKRASNLPCGIQILAGANEAALAVALSAGLDFIRAEGFVFAHVADEGIIESDAGTLLRYRKKIGAEHISILTDIKKKHSAHAITSDVNIVETAHVAEFFLSDGLILTGQLTGQAADLEMVKEVRQSTKLPILIGSGIDADNVGSFLPYCDGVIVGSSFKKDGHWAGELDRERVERFMEVVRGIHS